MSKRRPDWCTPPLRAGERREVWRGTFLAQSEIETVCKAVKECGAVTILSRGINAWSLHAYRPPAVEAATVEARAVVPATE